MRGADFLLDLILQPNIVSTLTACGLAAMDKWSQHWPNTPTHDQTLHDQQTLLPPPLSIMLKPVHENEFWVVVAMR